SMLTATYWTALKDGDIVLLDEFLRGYPEVYNGLLDILTSRQVGDHKLANVFFIAASNSRTAYDIALSDRLLHLAVPDPRKSEKVHNEMADRIVYETGMNPEIARSDTMREVLEQVVYPMYEVLDLDQSSTATRLAPNINGTYMSI